MRLSIWGGRHCNAQYKKKDDFNNYYIVYDRYVLHDTEFYIECSRSV